MTQTADRHAQATLSGRELALKRRQAMALRGKAGAVKSPTVASRPSAAEASALQPRASSSAMTANTFERAPAAAERAPLAPPVAHLSPARARRMALSQQGKTAIQKAGSGGPSANLRPSAQRTAPAPAIGIDAVSTREAASCGCKTEAACGCGCSDNASSMAPTTGSTPAAAAGDKAVRVQPAATGRALAQARRAALAQDGKAGLRRVAQATKIAAALPGHDWQAAMTKGATGRQVAMQRRHVQSLVGRAGSAADAARPSGRTKARNTASPSVAAPPKVELGHTLSGQSVTGTQVERSRKVTGNEPGSCRVITGTEYIGAEQFGSLCKTRPEPNPPKVGLSTTLRGESVTGTEVGRSPKVTGDEYGACRNVTGTEYLGAERFQQFCQTRPEAGAEKVGRGTTVMGQRFTGTLVDRPVSVTGGEQGAHRAITGTSYSAPGADTAPEKVEVTTTAGGKTVTGTGVGARKGMTGDEAGACRPVTGTQYLSNEQFTQVCNTQPPAQPRKVSVMSTRDGQTVTGTNAGRSVAVTGNEAGSARAVTGNQYFNAKDFGGAAQPGPAKVSAMQTLAGRTVTGSEVAPSPKLSGDESFGCQPVTGVDYIGTQQLAAVCAAPPVVAPVTKVNVDQTWRGLQVTGSLPAPNAKVTGAEAGVCAPISGDTYFGQGQYAASCPAPALHAQRNRMPDSATISARALTGDRPGAGGSVMTGDERGACEPVTGTPYVGADNMPIHCATSGRFLQRARPVEPPPRANAPQVFSILTPGHASLGRERGNAITGNGMGSERITGPINKADGLITGTPEFRKADLLRYQGQQQALLHAQQEQKEAALRAAQRLSGEGSTQGPRISGDVWLEKSRVTGTEGPFSQVRNLSMRGDPRGQGRNAASYRDLERPDVPMSPITGSSGNSGRGATVTVSGGARG